MSDEYKDNKIETKSTDSSSGGYAPPVEHIPAKEAPEQELYHAKSFWTKWVFSQDAKVIGVQYALTATAIGLIGLVLSWGMRLQLGFPETFSFLGPATYYQSVTMHGMIMVIYLLTALFLGGFGNYLIPLMVGARDMVFPYVNMVSYWMFLVAVLVLIASFFVPGGPTGAGWTLYPPQAILPGTPGSEYGIVLMLISLSLFVIGFSMGGLNYVITVLQARTRGMTLMRMPLTVWGIFTATVLALLAFPALLVACIMMTLDSLLGTSFFMPDIFTMGEKLKTGGGSPILFQHLFWFFGHPEVYIVALPAFGIVSDALKIITNGLKAKTILHTYFGDVSAKIENLLDLSVSGLGLDITTTPASSIEKHSFSDKSLTIGIINSFNTTIEKPQECIKQIDEINVNTKPKESYVSNNFDLEYVPKEFAMNKISVLGEIARGAKDV